LDRKRRFYWLEERKELKYKYAQLSSGTGAKSTCQTSEFWKQCSRSGYHKQKNSHFSDISWPTDKDIKENQIHCTLTWEYELKSGSKKLEKTDRRNFLKGDYKKFSDIMFELSLGQNDDPNESVFKLIEKYQDAFEQMSSPTV